MSPDKEQIKKAIWQTIVFFDIFSYPLTLFELWQYCSVALPDPEPIADILAIDELKDKIDFKDGFYFIAGRAEIVGIRQRRFNYTQRKIKRAQKIAKLFRFIPWIKLIAVGNNIGAFNLRDESDIDLFIVTAKGRIWLTRLFCVGAAIILGARPTKTEVKDTICLSFYVAEDGLNLAKFLLPSREPNQAPALERDPYFVFWLTGLVPILGRQGCWQKFFKENSWLADELPNWRAGELINTKLKVKNLPPWYEKIFEIIFSKAEMIAELIQLHIMPEATRKMLDKDTRVVANDKVIKLHVNDRRQYFLEKYNFLRSG